MRTVDLPLDGKMIIPDYVAVLLEKLEACGYEAYVVGGCVRDSILKKNVHDFDVCTNADCLEVKRIFESDFEVIPTGIKHGTVTIISQKHPIEVTTYRIDGKYSDNRHPEEVIFTKNLSEDLKRRDFTINSMAVSVNGDFKCVENSVEDLKCGLIRAVGTPMLRFNEDALRIMRAIRFSARLGFSIETETSRAMNALAENLGDVSAERRYDELYSMFDTSKADSLRNVIKEYSAIILTAILPKNMKNEFNGYLSSLDDFLLKKELAFEFKEESSSVAVNCFSTIIYGASLNPFEVMKSLKAPTSIIKSVTETVEALRSFKFEVSETGAGLLLMEFGEDNAYNIISCLKSLDLALFEPLKSYTDVYLATKKCYNLKGLAINGRDIISKGISNGPQVGEILKYLLRQVVRNKIPNEHDALLKEAGKYI